MTIQINANEYKVYKAIADMCFEEYSASVEELTKETGFTKSQIKGYVGSLVKKDLVHTDSEDRGGKTFHDIWIYFPGEGPIGFGWDNYTDDEWDNMVAERVEVA